MRGQIFGITWVPLFVPCHVRHHAHHAVQRNHVGCVHLNLGHLWLECPCQFKTIIFALTRVDVAQTLNSHFLPWGCAVNCLFFYLRVFLFADGHWVVWNHLLSDLIVFTLGRLLQTLFYGWKRVTMSLSGGVPVLHRGHFEKSFAILHHLCRFRQCFFSLLATVVRITFTLF